MMTVDDKMMAERRKAFTLIELLVVISIMAVLASLIVGLAGVSSRKAKESRVRAELHDKVTAIERYKSDFGYYPPDNLVNAATRQVNPAINQLFYELTGTVVDNVSGRFTVPGKPNPISQAYVKAAFHRDGFVNVTTDPKQIKSYIATKAGQVREVTLGGAVNVNVLAVPVDWPAKRPDQPTPTRQVNPWRYVSSNPTNNPNAFDLWAEIVIGSQVKIIPNWKE